MVCRWMYVGGVFGIAQAVVTGHRKRACPHRGRAGDDDIIGGASGEKCWSSWIVDEAIHK